jgi:dTDP-4-amino-4,6-dideoxygalactose transaminase
MGTVSAAAKRVLPSDANITGRSFGLEELRRLREVIESGTLNCTKGTAAHDFEARFAKMLGVPFCTTTTSGTAAIHAAIAAIDPEPGDEIVTTPITDMGAISPIIYQTAIPVFADVDPLTYNVTAKTIEACLTKRTKAVVVTHLFGNPCEMDSILALCKARNIPVIEDVAQSFLSKWKGKPLGTLGAIGCFSLQQGKHMSTGEGGMVVSSDPALARRMRLFIDKAWGYGDPKPDHYFLALNYRITELQGAVALAQLDKLEMMLQQRIAMADLLTKSIAGLNGISAPATTPGGTHVYWRYAIQVDSKLIKGGADGVGAHLKEYGIAAAPRYIQKLAFECEVLRDQRTFGKSKFPFAGPHRAGEPAIVYDKAKTPGAVKALERCVVLPLNEKYTPTDVEYVANAIRDAARALAV